MKYRERYDTKTFFKKRFMKVLIPFMFWSIFIIAWKICLHEIDINELSSISKFLNYILNNKEEATYFLMFDILGIYLTMPLLSLLAKEENRKTIWFTVLLYFIFNALIPNIISLFGINYNYSLSVQVGGYIVYVLLGYLFSTQEISKRNRVILYISACLGVLFRFLTTLLMSKASGAVIKITWGYCSWHCILLASAVFVFVKNMNINEKINIKFSKILAEISGCSFGIYLIHKVIIMYYEMNLFKIDVFSYKWRTLGIVTTYILSLFFVWIIKKIPILKKIVP